MTVSTTTNKISYTASGSQSTFAYPFKIFNEDDLNVYVRISGTDVLKTNYTVTGAGEENGGNIIFVAPYKPSAGEIVTIIRVLDMIQDTDYLPNDPFPAETHEDALDYRCMVEQQIQEQIGRGITVALTDQATDLELPNETSRANRFLIFDDDGNVSVSATTITGSTIDHATLAGLLEDDHIQYSLADGTRAFTGTVSGVSPTASAHLATKGYVDAADTVLDTKIDTTSGTLQTLIDNLDTGYATDAELTAVSGVLQTNIDTVQTNLTTHSGNIDIHRQINDSGTGTTDLWSADKIASEITTATGSLTTDHGELLGLADDDHTQYLLRTDFTTYSGAMVSSWQADDATLSAEIDADITTHAAVVDAHHTRYTDAEAIAAVNLDLSTLSGALSAEIDSDIATLSGALSAEDLTFVKTDGTRDMSMAAGQGWTIEDAITTIAEFSGQWGVGLFFNNVPTFATVASGIRVGYYGVQPGRLLFYDGGGSEGGKIVFNSEEDPEVPSFKYFIRNANDKLIVESDDNSQSLVYDGATGVNTFTFLGKPIYGTAPSADNVLANKLYVDTAVLAASVSGADHSTLSNLDYASSGHTGFAPTSHTHTESQISDLQDYVTEAEFTTYSGAIIAQIPSLSGYATEAYVTTVSGDIVAQIPSLSGYATESYVDSAITTASGDIVSQIPSLSGYATEAYVTTVSGDIVAQIPSLSGYATESYVDTAITTASGDIVSQIPANHSDLSLDDGTNPHGTTAADVGNGTAQWNANKLQGEPLVVSSGTGGQVIWYNGGGFRFENHTLTHTDISDYDSAYWNALKINSKQVSTSSEQERDVLWYHEGLWNNHALVELDISDLDKYTQAEVNALVAAASGTTDHSALNNLDYASAGHTGFQPAGDYVTDTEMTTISGDIITYVDDHNWTEADITDLGSYLENVVEDTTPQLGGDLDINDKYIMLDPVPASDDTGNGWAATHTVDANSTGIGAALYMASDGNLEEADASVSGTMPCRFLALEAGTGSKKVLHEGYFRDDSYTWTPGLDLYISETTGALTQTAPTTSGTYVQIVGYATHANRIYFKPDYRMVRVKS